ncbi:MAG: hypothetical protein J6P31_01520 [Oscillospiraceae bacterium]|nr:hypothetical protein [Oscillospiraceae bacterium]
MRRCLHIVFIGLLMFICFTACSSGKGSGNIGESSNSSPLIDQYETASSGSARFVIHSVSDFADQLNSLSKINVVVATILEPGSYSVYYAGIDEYIGYWVDSTTVLVEEVLGGNPNLYGKTITLEEVFGMKHGRYADPWFENPVSDRIVVCCGYNEADDRYVAYYPYYIAPIDENGIVHFDSGLLDAENYSTIDDFRSLFSEQHMHDWEAEREAFYQNPTNQIQNERMITDSEKEQFQMWLNDPGNNGFIRSEYGVIIDLDLDAVLQGGSALQLQDATDEQKSIYNTVTGKSTAHLKLLPNKDLELFLQMKTGCDYSVFERFTWLYMAEYDAWFAPEGDPAYIPVHCVGGTYDGGAYYVTYEPTGEAPANFQSGVVTLYPVGDGYYTMENHYNK